MKVMNLDYKLPSKVHFASCIYYLLFLLIEHSITLVWYGDSRWIIFTTIMRLDALCETKLANLEIKAFRYWQARSGLHQLIHFSLNNITSPRFASNLGNLALLSQAWQVFQSKEISLTGKSNHFICRKFDFHFKDIGCKSLCAQFFFRKILFVIMTITAVLMVSFFVFVFFYFRLNLYKIWFPFQWYWL